jgi:hypothetical protein
MKGKGLRLWFFALLGSATAGGPRVAQAQTGHEIEAESLFREARKLVDAGRLAEACEKFAASEQLEAAVGTLLNLGRCYEKIGRTATAWATYHEAIATAHASGQFEREKTAKDRADMLESTLPRLTITVSPQASASPIEVTRDGEVVPSALWGATVPVDPGEHIVQATANGKRRWSKKANVEAHDSVTMLVPMLETEAASEVTSNAPLSSPSTDVAAIDAQSSSSWNGYKTAAMAVGGVGAAGIALAVFEGMQVLSKKSDFDGTCPGGRCAEPQATAANRILDDATKARTVSIVAGTVGAGCIVGAVIFWIAGQRSSPSATGGIGVIPTAESRRVGIAVSGRW